VSTPTSRSSEEIRADLATEEGRGGLLRQSPIGRLCADVPALLAERDALRAAIQAATETKFYGYETRDIGRAYVADSVDDLLDALADALAVAGVDREDTEQPRRRRATEADWAAAAKAWEEGEPAELHRDLLRDTGQADEPQPTDRREWTQADVPDLLAAMGGLVVPQQPTCEHGYTRAHGHGGGLLSHHESCPGPVGQDTT
jgi:hypothetical protein